MCDACPDGQAIWSPIAATCDVVQSSCLFLFATLISPSHRCDPRDEPKVPLNTFNRVVSLTDKRPPGTKLT